MARSHRHGTLVIVWNEMMPWAQAFGFSDWLETYRLAQEQSSIDWDVKPKIGK